MHMFARHDLLCGHSYTGSILDDRVTLFNGPDGYFVSKGYGVSRVYIQGPLIGGKIRSLRQIR